MGTLSDIRDGLAEVIADACPGVTVHRLPSPAVDVPAVVLGGFTFDEATFGGVHRVTLDVFVVVSGRDTDLIGDLDALVDPSRSDSVVSAIQNEPDDLGGRGMDARVVSVGEYRPEDNAGSPAYAATVKVEVML